MALRQRGWNWSSALVGAASAAAATVVVVVLGRPRDATFRLISITLSSFRLNLPLLDVDLTLTVLVTNPNLAPIHYAPAC
ncbi:hypothetical protein B296_00046057 [Ensete ventricosum]|uniref:Late embryogenesis abundant protein LEA-2 subgroup domain-containing protein n=1 Tax=Ensete ventricosum TaxID=4639 RepID=A0A426YMQ2_ENSVE|nr:hypothetical protein B296_00046057 [Ensete ventricosum]